MQFNSQEALFPLAVRSWEGTEAFKQKLPVLDGFLSYLGGKRSLDLLGGGKWIGVLVGAFETGDSF